MEVREPISNYGDLDLSKSYDYWDYLQFNFKERLELIKGRIFKMSPAPSSMHQKVSMSLTKEFLSNFNNIPCNIFAAPFDVRLPIPNTKKNNTVVQPDLCVICDKTKIDKRGGDGAPDLIVEILSPYNTEHDLRTKFNLYEEAGVLEYWIVDIEQRTILIYELINEKYIGSKPFIGDMTIESPLFPSLSFQAETIFEGVDEIR